MEKKPLVILSGPTAVGKTALSISLAKSLNGEIISADSMQVYKGMDIGSAKITEEEKHGITHYLIDILEPTNSFNVHSFQGYAKEAMDEIYKKGKLPIIVGGTGFYIQSVAYDIEFTDENEDSDYRKYLSEIARTRGEGELFKLLMEQDEKSARTIHPNNVKRVIRALEYIHLTGKPISEHNETQRQRTSPYKLYYYVLTDERALVYERIDKRVDLMIEQGFVDEVKQLKKLGVTREMTSAQGLGYKEIYAYLDGEYDLERAISLIKRNTRHFAKRQITWFKRERDVIWIEKGDFKGDEDIASMIVENVRSGIGQ